MTISYYTLLEITYTATDAEIKAAYRRLAMKFHPDRNPNNAEAQHYFRQVKEAYEVLSNPLKRQQYDIDLKKNGQFQFDTDPLVLNTLHKNSLDLHKYLIRLEQGYINRNALYDYLLELLDEDKIKLLLRAPNYTELEETAQLLFEANKKIISITQFERIAQRILLLLKNTQSPLNTAILQEIEQRKKQEQKNKLVPILSLLILFIVFCIMLFIIYN